MINQTIKEKEDKYTELILPELANIKRYIACGVTEQQIYFFYGISKTQWHRYKKKYPKLQEAITVAKNHLEADLISKAYQIAMGYVLKETKGIYTITGDEKALVQEIVTTKDVKPDANMIQWILINRFPDKYARDPQIIDLRKKELENKKTGNDTEGV